MQSGPYETSTDTVSSLDHQSSPATTQHGSDVFDTSLPHAAAAAARAAGDELASASSIAEYDARHTDNDLATHAERRLSAASTPSPPPGNRIAEYEQASTPISYKSEQSTFRVINRPRSPHDKRSPIQDLPNEIIIHALVHLAPPDLAAVSLVSKRFNALITGPHAWRSAFAQFFPGAQTLVSAKSKDEDVLRDIRSSRRAFTRLSALASWRSEYILRTRLLRSLYRGKPLQAPAVTATTRASQATNAAVPTVAYNSSLHTTINHIHGTFGDGSSKRLPRFIHGADEMGHATSSEPLMAKVDSWGLSDPQMFLSFADRFPGDAEYGLGPGEVVGAPNVMDVSQPFGMICGEGSPAGLIYFRAADELRGRFLSTSSGVNFRDLGIPRVNPDFEAITSVWISKSSAIPDLTDGLIGLLSGSSLGVLNAYSLGPVGNQINRGQRFARGETTARWVLSPGVPLIAIAVDNEYSLSRYSQNRIWAVVLNALGEVFYLTKFPKRSTPNKSDRLDEHTTEKAAWLTGRTVYWSLVEPSRRIARPDPYADTAYDGSYSPRTSWNGMCLSQDQIRSETVEIEEYLKTKPKDFHKSCLGWDMRRRLEVDFAGDDGHNAGENIVVIACGCEEHSQAKLTRHSRRRIVHGTSLIPSTPPSLTAASTNPSTPPSIFGAARSPVMTPSRSPPITRLDDSLSLEDLGGTSTPRQATEEWCVSNLALGGLKGFAISTSVIDMCHFAVTTTSEDPLLSFSGCSTTSSPPDTPTSPSAIALAQPSEIPGQRARFIAVGTLTGTVLIWDMRASIPHAVEAVNTIDPVRVIHTESPQISSLALTSLYLVHGGNDGLVQAWDPLGSTLLPIRTLNSKFISRARRRLVQAQASPQGVGVNLFAVGAICLDPDPTVLRGIVSLGLQLLYWSFSSSGAEQYRTQKRRLRRAERGSNNGGEQFSGAPRANLKNYIASERYELDRERRERQKAADRFAGRFGTDLLDGSEEEMIAYAALLSQESLEQEQHHRSSNASTVVSSAVLTPVRSPSVQSAIPKSDDELDADIAEAIRQSLTSTPSRGDWDIPFKPMKTKARKGSSTKTSPRFSPVMAGSSKALEMSDLDYALQISLAEEQSRLEALEDDEEFPTIGGSGGFGSKNKGKGRRT